MAYLTFLVLHLMTLRPGMKFSKNDYLFFLACVTAFYYSERFLFKIFQCIKIYFLHNVELFSKLIYDKINPLFTLKHTVMRLDHYIKNF